MPQRHHADHYEVQENNVRAQRSSEQKNAPKKQSTKETKTLVPRQEAYAIRSSQRQTTPAKQLRQSLQSKILWTEPGGKPKQTAFNGQNRHAQQAAEPGSRQPHKSNGPHLGLFWLTSLTQRKIYHKPLKNASYPA